MEDVNKQTFEELYENLYNENFNELESLRKEKKKTFNKYIVWISTFAVGFVLALILSQTKFIENGIVYWLCLVLMAIGVIGVMITFTINITKWAKKYNILDDKKNINKDNLNTGIKKEQSYRYAFKEKIIKPIVEYAIEGSSYSPTKGLSDQEYYRGYWEKGDRYSSDDEIICCLNVKDEENNKLQLIMSEVFVEDEEHDENGPYYVTIFQGLAGYVRLPKNIGAYIKITKNKSNIFGKSKSNIEMDMEEFEKIFDVETNDKIKAMQIFTSEIMSEFVDIVKTTNVKFDIYINHNIMHIRFHTGKMFEPEIFGKSIQFNKLKQYFDIVTSVKNVTERICMIINQMEI